jgi:hypothetical protein
MFHDVLVELARDQMSKTDNLMVPSMERPRLRPTVAQPHRNRRSNDVAQRTCGDRLPHTQSFAAVTLGLWATAALGLGCASPTTAPSPPDGASKDAAQDAQTGACAEDCAAKVQVCSLNRCTSSACATAERKSNSVAGCLFYTLQADNVTADEAATTSFLVTGQGPDLVHVELQQSQSTADGPVWTEIAGAQIGEGGTSARLSVSAFEVVNAGVTLQGALRISTDRPVTVAEIESDDVQSPATSSGGTMILPRQALGFTYRAVTYPQQATPDLQSTVGSRGGAARVMVVGTQAGTEVTFKPVGPVTRDPNGGTPDFAVGDSLTFTLGDGDVFQIYSGAEDEDLTGSLVTAKAPVAVFSGNISTTYGSQVVGINSADMAHEQMPPLPSWSTTYVAAALTPQASIDCTSFFGPDGGSIWRVLASEDGTLVTLSGPAIGATPTTFMLDAGMAKTIVEAGSFVVSATDPILVTQGIDCEPSLSLAMAVGATNLFKSLPFAVPPGFDLLLGIVRPAGAAVELDGAPIDDASFQAVGAQFEVAAIPLAPCAPTDGSGVCTHQVTSPSGVGMTVRGMDVGSSYALAVPLLVLCNDPNSELCLN